MYIKSLIFFLMFSLCVCSARADSVFSEIKEKYNADVSKGMIYIDKQELMLYLYSANGDLIKQYPVSCGKSLGHKQKSGDMKTPEGVFSVQEIVNASAWGHDFKDGKGYIPNCYGNWFIRLKTGFNGIGIHGTHDPASIGTRATEGCIRLQNDNLDQLKPLVNVGMTVIIGKDL